MLPITNQSLSDLPGLQSLATDFLVKMHNLKKSQQLINGVGSATEPAGVLNIATTITLNAGLTSKVVAPNITDVINGMATTMYLTHNYVGEMPNLANVVLVTPADFYVEFVSAKDSQGLPLYPTASLMNRVAIGNMLVVPKEEVTAGTIIVCDMSKY